MPVLDADGNGYTNEEDFIRIALVRLTGTQFLLKIRNIKNKDEGHAEMNSNFSRN